MVQEEKDGVRAKEGVRFLLFLGAAVALLGVLGCGTVVQRAGRDRDGFFYVLKYHRMQFEHGEYASLSPLAREGYRWYWEHMWESGGAVTRREENRIRCEHGENGLAQWRYGFKKADEIFRKAAASASVPPPPD